VNRRQEGMGARTDAGVAFAPSCGHFSAMKLSLGRIGSALLIALGLCLAGCGEKRENVDVNAQLAGLAGDADAKVAALAEISKAGPDAASAVSKIIPLLKDEDAVVRRTAAFALGAIGPAAKEAVPTLKEMMQTTDRDQLTAVANALRSIEPSAAGGVKIENVSGGESVGGKAEE